MEVIIARPDVNVLLKTSTAHHESNCVPPEVNIVMKLREIHTVIESRHASGRIIRSRVVYVVAKDSVVKSVGRTVATWIEASSLRVDGCVRTSHRVADDSPILIVVGIQGRGIP